jgi:hypothetical protein
LGARILREAMPDRNALNFLRFISGLGNEGFADSPWP